MAIPSSFFQAKTISQWYQDLMSPCRKKYNHFYNATTLQKKNTFEDMYMETWKKLLENFDKGRMSDFPNDKESGYHNKPRFYWYFLQIFYRLMLAENNHYKGGKNYEVSFDETIDEGFWEEEEGEDFKTLLFEQLDKAFSKLGEKCKQLLSASYLGAERMSGEEIAKQFGMKDGIAVNRKLGKCRDRLRELINR